MQLRTIALICSLAGVIYSGATSALGLGEITLKSRFNQPLDAEIRLLKVRDLSVEEILVELASREDFDKAGVDRVFFLTGMRFEVMLDNPSRPYIRVTTSKPVTEPYLDFLLQLQWPSGRLLREYTLLMDLPTFNETPSSVSITAPSSGSSSPPPTPPPQSPAPGFSLPGSQTSDRQVSQSSPPSTGQTVPAAVSSIDRYRVKSGDTLSQIAARVRSGSSVNQTMIAIQRANPNAFIDGNINRLRSGRVLRVPSAEEIASIDYSQAVTEVGQQRQEWLAERTQGGPALTATDLGQPAVETVSQPEGRLTLDSASANYSSDIQGAGVSGEGSSLQKELVASQEELDRSRRENSELQSRISELEAQIDTMERLVAVTNNRLAELRGALDANQQEAIEQEINQESDAVDSDLAAALPADDAELSELLNPEDGQPSSDTDLGLNDSGLEPAVDPQDLTFEEIASEEIASEEIASEDDPAAAEPAPVEEFVLPAEEPLPPVEPAAASFDIVEFIKRHLLIVGGGLFALLLAVIALWRLREKPEDEDDFDLEDDDDFGLEDDNETAGAEGEDEFRSMLDEDDFATDKAMEVVEDGAESVQAQTEDVVAEADIYISLGQEDKAIELLQKEIHQNPDNADARLSLLKIHANAQDAAAFDEQYAQLLPLGNIYANDQATLLRQEIAGIDPFDTAPYSLDEQDVGGVAEALSFEEAEIEGPGAEKAESNEVELVDLEADRPESIEEKPVEQKPEETLDRIDAAGEELDLDLDLDFDLGDSAEQEQSLDALEGLEGLDGLEDLEGIAPDSALPGDDTELDFAGLSLDLDDEVGDDLSGLSVDEDTADGALAPAADKELAADQESAADKAPAADKGSEPLDLDDDLSLDSEFSLDLDLSDEGLADESLAEDGLDDKGLEGALGEVLDDEIDIELDKDLDESLALDSNIAEDLAALDIDEGIDKDGVEGASVDEQSAGQDSASESDDNSMAETAGEDVLDTVDSSELDLDIDEDFVNNLGDLDVDSDGTTADKPDLDLDLPPPDDIDMASLDQEIDAMTAELDQPLEGGEDGDTLELLTDDDSDLESFAGLDAADDLDVPPELDEDLSSLALEEDDLTLSSSLEDGEVELELESEAPDAVESDSSDPDPVAEADGLATAQQAQEDDLDFLEESDEVSTKLDLAKAYLDMGDREGAEDILGEVIEEGNSQQKDEAQALMSQI